MSGLTEQADAAAAGAASAATTAAEQGDTPEASGGGKVVGAALLVAAVVISKASDGHAPAFAPDTDFKLFAGFLVVAQAIERLLEFGSGLVPKPDRGLVIGGASVVLGVLASKALGLYFLSAISVTEPHRWIDILVSGLLLGGGTKGLHDLLGRIEKAKDNAAASAATAAAVASSSAAVAASHAAVTKEVAQRGQGA